MSPDLVHATMLFNPAPPAVSQYIKASPSATANETPPITPTTLSSTAHTLYAEITQIHGDLLTLTSLAPGEQINCLLTRLVKLCIEPHDAAFTSYFFAIPGADKLCASLHRICASAERELEKYWANVALSNSNISGHKSTETALLQFPYYSNYTELSLLECSLLKAFLPPTTLSSPPLQIAFLGSGPLPLTSLNLHTHFPTASIWNVDRDAAALKLSSELTANLGLECCMRNIWGEIGAEQGGGEEAIAWASFDVVFLAALVGMGSSEKVGILRWLRKRLRRGCLVVARSAWGLRKVLYPVLEFTEELREVGLEVLAEVHSWTSVVNSVVVMRVK